MLIRSLVEDDAAAYWKFRLLALQSDPVAFGEAAEEHERSPIERMKQRIGGKGSENFVLGAFVRSKLIGTVGFYRETRLKRMHKGGIWGMFVAREHRGKGVAKALMQKAIEEARKIQGLKYLHLSVTSRDPAVRKLYLGLGFEPYGLEPQAILVDGEYHDEELMSLKL